TGTVVTAKIKLDSGLYGDPNAIARAFLTAKSGAGYLYAPGASINLDAGEGWVTLTMDGDQPGGAAPIGYVACDIREIDVEIDTGNSGTYVPAVVHIDTISVTSKTGAVDAATDGGPATDGGTDVPVTPMDSGTVEDAISSGG